MTPNETTTQELVVPSRTAKATTERMLVRKDGPDYHVETYNDDEKQEYRVFSDGIGCECKDYEYRKPTGGCKHMRRVDMTTGEAKIPPADLLPSHENPDAALLLQRYNHENGGIQTVEQETIMADGGVATNPAVESEPDSGEDTVLSESVEMSLFVHGIVCEHTSTVDLLPDFEENGEPYCQSIQCAHDTVMRLIGEEIEVTD